MAFILKDRVKESTTTTGTGNISLGGALATFDTFQTYLSNGDTTFYAIAHTSSGVDEWEVGLGTWNTGNTLTRTTVLAGSNSTSAVTFSAGTKDVFMTYPASKAIVSGEDAAFANITVTGTVDGRDIAADGTKLDGVEASADVTDTANVTSAGALMRSGGTMTGSLVLNANPSAALGAATKQYVDTEVSSLVDSAPSTLDTLNELAAALGDDANFSTTVTNSIATKLPLAGGTLTGNLGIGHGPSGYLTAGYVLRLYGGTQTYLAFNNSTHTTQVLGGFVIGHDGGAARITQRENQPIIIATNDTTRMTITSAGNVGIGTSSPSSFSNYTNLTIQGGSSGANLDFFKSDGSRTAAIVTTSGGGLIIETNTTDNPITFKTGTSGTERMRIDSSGRVGIGTSSPASKLSVAGDIKTTIDNSIIAPYGSLLGFVKKSGAAGSIAYASGQSLIFTQSSASSLSDASAETYTERMRISSAGLVGIGTSSPSDKFHVDGAGAFIRVNRTDGEAGITLMYNGSNSTRSNISTLTNGDLQFETANTERMRIDSNGRVMIAETSNSGYSNNADDLIVGDNGSSTERGISLGSTLASTIRFNDGSDAGTIEYVHSENSMRFGTNNGTERMRIDSSGNVGIGTSSPAGVLDIRNGTTQQVIIGNSGTYTGSEYGELLFKEQSTELARVKWNPSGNTFQLINNIAGPMTFATSGSERMRLDASGNLLVGKTSVDTTTDGLVMRERGQVYATSDGNTPVILNRRSSDGNIIDLRKDNSTVGSIGSAGGSSNELYIYAASGKGILLNNNGLLAGTSSGGGSDNTTDLGQADVRFKDLYLSGTAKISSTQVSTYTVSGISGGSVDTIGGDIVTGRIFFTGSGDSGTDLFGINNESSGLVIYNYVDGHYSLKIDNSNNIGVGKSNPAHKLDVNGDVLAAGLYVGAANTSFDFYNNGTSYLNGATTIDANTQINGHLGIGGTATDANWVDATYGNTEVSIDGGGGYGVLHLRGDGGGSTNTRYSVGVGDSTFYMAYDDVDGVHRVKINSSHQLILNEGSGDRRAFHDGYHPNADAWTTSRTLSLTGDATGSVSIDGSSNVSLNVNVGDADLLDGYHGSNYIGKNGNTYYRPNTWIDFRDSNGSGLYWGSGTGSGWHIYPVDSQDMQLRSGASGNVGLQLSTTGTARGYVYANSSNQVGFLNNSRNWSLKVDNSGNTFATASHRAPIFYDSNDTAYYLDPASTSVVNQVIATNIEFGDTSGPILSQERNQNLKLQGSSGTDVGISGYGADGNWDFQLYGSGGQQGFLKSNWGSYAAYADTSGNWFGTNSVRAPIFYDSDNTAYYVDPSSNSSMYGISIRGDVSSTGTANQIFLWTNSATTTSAIGFKSSGGQFASPTGNGDGYNTYLTMDTVGRGWVFRRGTGGGDFTAAYTSGWILNNGHWTATTSMRAPIFYDYNDTNYYVDPASTSDSALRVRGGALFGGNTTWGDFLLVGGDGRQNYLNNTTTASVVTTDGNLHLDAASGHATYLNYYDGDIVYFGSGSNGIVGRVTNAGVAQFASFTDNNDTAYYVDPNSTSNLIRTDIQELNVNGGTRNNTNDATVYITATNNNDWGLIVNKYNASSSEYGVDIRMGSSFSYGLRVTGAGSTISGISSSQLYHNYSVRGPIFYDSDNTAYYFDGSATGDSIRVAGNIVAYYSDERLKNIEGNIDSPLEKVSQLNGFYYKANKKAQTLGYKDNRQVGVSAQEVEAVMPEVVTDAAIGYGYKTVDYAKLVPLLIEAVKEQQDQIETLKSRLEKLEN